MIIGSHSVHERGLVFHVARTCQNCQRFKYYNRKGETALPEGHSMCLRIRYAHFSIKHELKLLITTVLVSDSDMLLITLYIHNATSFLTAQIDATLHDM